MTKYIASPKSLNWTKKRDPDCMGLNKYRNIVSRFRLRYYYTYLPACLPLYLPVSDCLDSIRLPTCFRLRVCLPACLPACLRYLLSTYLPNNLLLQDPFIWKCIQSKFLVLTYSFYVLPKFLLVMHLDINVQRILHVFY